MRKFAIENDLSGVIKKTSIKTGATIITKVSEAEARLLANRPTYFSVNIDPDPFTDNTFKVAFSKEPVRGKYAFGTVVTISEQEGYTIESVLANDDALVVDDGEYTFTVTEATDVVVETKAETEEDV